VEGLFESIPPPLQSEADCDSSIGIDFCCFSSLSISYAAPEKSENEFREKKRTLKFVMIVNEFLVKALVKASEKAVAC
jgi:hypothetical protein